MCFHRKISRCSHVHLQAFPGLAVPAPVWGQCKCFPSLPPSLQKPWGKRVEVVGQFGLISVCVSLLPRSA